MKVFLSVSADGVWGSTRQVGRHGGGVLTAGVGYGKYFRLERGLGF